MRQLTPSDLDPVKVWTSAENRVNRIWERGVKSYENMRLVYEIQTRLSEWQAEAPEAQNQGAQTPAPARKIRSNLINGATDEARFQMSETTIAGYCRACGKALTESEVHRAHGALYCKEHAPQEGASPSPYNVPPVPSAYGGLPLAAGVSPGAALWLGLIPGVGAIYNGQYAKGFVHVAVIALGFSIINNDAAGGFEPLVGMMIAAFWAYMPFEAYHTARNRQWAGRWTSFPAWFPCTALSFPPSRDSDRAGHGAAAEQSGDLRIAAGSALLAGAADRRGSVHAVQPVLHFP